MQLHPNQFLACMFIFDLVMCHSSSIPEVVLASKYLSNLSFNLIKCCYCIYIFSKALGCLLIMPGSSFSKATPFAWKCREYFIEVSTLKEKSLIQYMENSVNIQSVCYLKMEKCVQAAAASEVTSAYFIVHLWWAADAFMGQLIVWVSWQPLIRPQQIRNI